jgi:hypothetical protein
MLLSNVSLWQAILPFSEFKNKTEMEISHLKYCHQESWMHVQWHWTTEESYWNLSTFSAFS